MGGERVLVVEDEEDLREVLVYNLEREGYKVRAAPSGSKALHLVQGERPDLVLLDLMLPDLDGIEVCRRLRSDAETQGIAIIMVTAKDDETDVVLGFGMGADDYVTKPFRVKEVLARVRAVLRRGGPAPAEEEDQVIRRGELVIDPARHQVRLKGEVVPFTATEFRLLRVLARRPGRVYTRPELLRMAMGDDTSRLDRNVDVHVRAIRKKLGRMRELIETVRGVGYRFRDQGR